MIYVLVGDCAMIGVLPRISPIDTAIFTTAISNNEHLLVRFMVHISDSKAWI